MKKSYLVRAMRPLIHLVIFLVVFFLMYKLRLVTDLIPWVQLPIPQMDYLFTMLFAILSSIGFVVIGMISWLYIIHRRADRSFFLLLKVWLAWLIVNTFFLYFWTGLLRENSVSRFVLLVSGTLSLVLCVLFDSIWYYLEKRWYKKNTKQDLIISTNITNHHNIITQITEYSHANITVIEPQDIIYDENLQHYASIYIIGDVGKQVLQDVFDQIRFASTRFFHFSEGQFVQDVVYKPEYIANTIALEYTHSTLDGWSLVFKRVFDIVVSIIALIVLSPVFVITAIAIKRESKGPILFFQKRVGRWGKLFTFVKFRSMLSNAEALKKDLLKKNERKGPLFKIKDDPRITKVGKFLRRTSIDELPQLFCVLAGTMSLVGPRPHLPAEVERYEEREKRLLSVTPWITGYAQVFGRDNIPFSQEAKLDLYYIQNWSVAMDIYVILNTFLVVFKGK